MAAKGKILVSGGAGYIGSHTVVALSEAGYEAVIVDSLVNSSEDVMLRLEKITGQKVKFYRADCVDENALNQIISKEGRIAGVIHFAAFKAVGESVEKPLLYYHNNIGSLLAVLRVMEKSGIDNLVFSSSCTVYGMPDKLPVTEQTPFKPAESPYGQTKQICEDILQNVAKAGNPRTIALRYFNPVGAHESALIGELPLGVPNNLVPFITQTAAGMRKELTVFGDDYDTADGSCIRDFIHVMDLAEAHVAALSRLFSEEGDACEVFNIGTGKGNSVLELISTFEQVSGKQLPYKIGSRRPGDISKIYADVTKAKQVLGWEAKRTLSESLLSSWRWQQTLS